MGAKQRMYAMLAGLGVPFQTVEHPAAFTVEDIQAVEFPAGTRVPKNLFLRDAKGKRHFLVVVDAAQPVDLRRLERVLGSTRLSFASPQRLQKHLGLTKGSVSPLGLVNDAEHAVELYIDSNLMRAGAIGVHPNDNTATVLLRYDSLLAFFRATGHRVHPVDFAPVGE